MTDSHTSARPLSEQRALLHSRLLRLQAAGVQCRMENRLEERSSADHVLLPNGQNPLAPEAERQRKICFAIAELKAQVDRFSNESASSAAKQVPPAMVSPFLRQAGNLLSLVAGGAANFDKKFSDWRRSHARLVLSANRELSTARAEERAQKEGILRQPALYVAQRNLDKMLEFKAHQLSGQLSARARVQRAEIETRLTHAEVVSEQPGSFKGPGYQPLQDYLKRVADVYRVAATFQDRLVRSNKFTTIIKDLTMIIARIYTTLVIHHDEFIRHPEMLAELQRDYKGVFDIYEQCKNKNFHFKDLIHEAQFLKRIDTELKRIKNPSYPREFELFSLPYTQLLHPETQPALFKNGLFELAKIEALIASRAAYAESERAQCLQALRDLDRIQQPGELKRKVTALLANTALGRLSQLLKGPFSKIVITIYDHLGRFPGYTAAAKAQTERHRAAFMLLRQKIVTEIANSPQLDESHATRLLEQIETLSRLKDFYFSAEPLSEGNRQAFQALWNHHQMESPPLFAHPVDGANDVAHDVTAPPVPAEAPMLPLDEYEAPFDPKDPATLHESREFMRRH